MVMEVVENNLSRWIQTQTRAQGSEISPEAAKNISYKLLDHFDNIRTVLITLSQTYVNYLGLNLEDIDPVYIALVKQWRKKVDAAVEEKRIPYR